jgi:acetoin utilization deacetylase AcuC-like enzyme
MKVFFHPDFYQVYTNDPAAEAGRLEAVMEIIAPRAELSEPAPAPAEAIAAVHGQEHIAWVQRRGLYPIASLAAGAALAAGRTGRREPCFGLLRPPGHHASADSSWGFCYFNNMAVALTALQNAGAIATAHVLDIDLHYGDGTVNILGERDWVRVYNPQAREREAYLPEVAAELEAHPADLIGISAGFDLHQDDWGGRLSTGDYRQIGRLAAAAARRAGGGVFAILEGGYNHAVLGHNVLALMEGMQQGWTGSEAD